MKLEEIFRLEPHGLDVVVGAGPKYPWGGLYGGQIVAQGLLAAAQTVDEELAVHSLRAYFIRRGDQDEPVRYEVDRIRNGRSFATRRVVARQAVGAILNLEASFQRPEESVDRQTIQTGGNADRISNLTVDQWSPTFERAFLPPRSLRERRELERGGRLPGFGQLSQCSAGRWFRPLPLRTCQMICQLTLRCEPIQLELSRRRCAIRCSLRPALTTQFGSIRPFRPTNGCFTISPVTDLWAEGA